MASWTNGLFDCFSGDWLCGWCCPCVMYSRVNHRLNHPEDGGMQNFSNCNGYCWGWYCLQVWTGCGGIFLQCIQRQQIREKLHINGDSGTDFLLACCCHCCAWVQAEEELKNPQQREKLLGQGAGAGKQPYQPPQQQQMAYGAPPQPQEQYGAPPQPQQPMAYGAPHAPEQQRGVIEPAQEQQVPHQEVTEKHTYNP